MLIIRARVARRSPVWVYAAKSIGYTALLWAVFLFGLPALIWRLEEALGLTWTRFDSHTWRPVAVTIFTAGSLIGFWSGYILVRIGDGTPMPLEGPRHLVIAGPYRTVRNPMSAMGILQGLAVGLYLGSTLVMVYALIGALVWNYLLRPWEERDLAERFGAEFDL